MQFACFSSTIEPEAILESWEQYVRKLVKNPADIRLHARVAKPGSRTFQYVSQQLCPAELFSYSFLKGKSQADLAVLKASIRLAGGYLRTRSDTVPGILTYTTRVFAFVPHGDTRSGFIQDTDRYALNRYEAYFENCLYSQVLEFILPPNEVAGLLTRLKENPGVEAASYAF